MQIEVSLNQCYILCRWANESDRPQSERCSQISGRRILINYADGCCKLSQPYNFQTGLTTGGFDVCVQFNAQSIDSEFKKRNSMAFNSLAPSSKYWIWKPYIVWKTLHTMNENDVLFYADSGSHFVDNFELGPICLMAETNVDIAVFQYQQQEKIHSKADAFLLMNCMEEKCQELPQLTAAFVLLRKTPRSLEFVSQWLTYAQDFRILNNDPSQMVPDPQEFQGHRNDQSIISILAKKWNLEQWPDPSQWGEITEFGRKVRGLPKFASRLNRTFINHTRKKI